MQPLFKTGTCTWVGVLVASLIGFIGPARVLSATALLGEPRRPNIVVIIADDLGFADVGVHGGRDLPTPNIDSIARAGVRCSSGYVSGPYCSPTRAGLLSGRYQQRFGHEFNPPGPNATNRLGFGLPLDIVTLADRLKGAGYVTGLVGKWHLGASEPYNPVKRGFDEFFGFLGALHSYTNLAPDSPNPIRRGLEPVEEKEYLTDAFTREGLSFIERHQRQPFYLQLAYNAVHSPLDAPARYYDRFSHIADEKRRRYTALYAAFDEGVGRILDRLRRLDLEKDTLVVFFSDNGGPTDDNTSRNEPLRGFKAQTWEGGIRIPFFLRWPGKLPAGQVYDKPVIQLDIHATALAAAGVTIQPEWRLDGVDLIPYLTGRVRTAPHETLFWRFGSQLAVRKGDWKLVKAASGTPNMGSIDTGSATVEGAELYNLAKDLGESKNLAANHPAKVRELSELWNQWNRELSEPSWKPGTRPR